MTDGYSPSPSDWVRDQVEAIVTAGDTAAASIQGRSVILMTMTGAKTGRTLKVPVMRVEHDGTYLAVASKGGAPEHPQWYHNLVAHPEVVLQDGTEEQRMHARVVSGAERETWWERAVAAFPPYADYQASTDREIPLVVLEPGSAS